MDDHVKCPICFQTPELQIFQCVRGHTICHVCILKIQLCPQCRIPYGSTKIRNRVLEQILDKQEFDCVYKVKGCEEKLKRQSITKHEEICPFNNIPVYLCKALGYERCNHVLNPSNRSETIKHFVETHGAVNERGPDVIIVHQAFKPATGIVNNSRWPLILLNVDEKWCQNSLFMIVGTLDKRREAVSWICLQICGSTKKGSIAYEAEFAIEDIHELDMNVSKFPPYRWTLPVVNVKDEDIGKYLTRCPINLSLGFLEQFCSARKEISVSVLILPRKKSMENHSITGIPKICLRSKSI
ncbi:unnamed protein product [Orchesella dallaii]|uniref:RING-type domain-containing protein n=1 Tax=Orchesella dallaii TaxID=48710 RepID=A0ABP1PHT7_9HEXA